MTTPVTTKGQTPIIDAWIQHPTPKLANDPIFDSIKKWMGVTEVPDLPLEMTIGALDAAGIARAMICAWYGPQGPIVSNDEVASFVERYPDRLIGVASVDLRRPMDAVRELRRAVREQGMRALRILPWLWDLPPDDRRYYPVYAECIELGIPFCLQVGHTGPLHPSEPGRPIPYLDHVALEFPELVIVAGHIGYPWTTEMITLATKYPNVYIDTSAYKPSRYPAEFVDYMKGRGRKKVLYASDYPLIMPKDYLSQLDLLGLDDETTQLFLHDNAARIFGL